MISPLSAHITPEPDSAFARMICDAVPAPVFVLDGRRRVLAASPEMLDLIGYAPQAFLGEPIAEFMAGSSVRVFKEVFWPSLINCNLAEDSACELTTRQGMALQIRLTGRAVLDSAESVSHVVCAAEDLTVNTLSEAKFAALFALSPVPMLVRRLADTRVLDANPAFLAMTGQGTDSLVGHAMEEVATFEPAHLRHRLEHDLRTGRPVRAAGMHVRTQYGAMLDLRVTTAIVQAFNQSCSLLILQDPARGRFDEQQLFTAIETVMQDTSWFSRAVVEKLAALRTPASKGARVAELDDLTKREREVLAMISHGWSDADIAGRLNLTRSTIRNHVAALYGKIGVHSRSSTIVWARDRALNIIHPAAGLGQPSARLSITNQPAP